LAVIDAAVALSCAPSRLAGSLVSAAGNIELLGELIRLRQIAQQCAKDAAPYYHPKLASVSRKGDAENPLLGPVTDADRIKAIVAFFQANPDVLKLLMAELVARETLALSSRNAEQSNAKVYHSP
jgi:hypothetical protein